MKFNLLKLATVVSVFIIFSFSGVVDAATLSIITNKDTYATGDQFNADIKIDSQDVGVNAGQATIKFSPAVLQVVSVDKTSSVFNFWIQDPTFDNNAGQITFIGGASSGLVGKSLQVVRVVFKAKGEGEANFIFTDGAITASDGSGTNVLSAMNKTTVNIASTAPTGAGPVQTIERTPITSDTNPSKPIVNVSLYPDPSKWYNISSKFSANWQLPNDISAVATALNKNPSTNPSTSQGIFNNQSFSALADGVWYLHVRFYNNIGGSVTNHYRLAIDTVPPSASEIKFLDGVISDNPVPTIDFQAKDQLSGIDNYNIQIDSNPSFDIKENIYTLPAQKPGKHILKVGVQDKAGNKIENKIEFEILPITSPKIFSTSTNVFVGEGGLFVNGKSTPNSSVILDVIDEKESVFYNFKTNSDENGIWSMKIDSPLKKGTYYVLATAQDTRGALSLPVKSDAVFVKDRPILTIFGFGITYSMLIVILLIILVGGYIIGWYSNKLLNRQRQRRILISERDVTSSFNVMKKDVTKALKNWEDGKLENHELTEIEFLLKHINDNIDKLQKYIISGIKDIGRK